MEERERERETESKIETERDRPRQIPLIFWMAIFIFTVQGLTSSNELLLMYVQ